MYDRLSTGLMRWLRVPPKPEPPLGAPGSERVFRSGRNALRLSLALWGIKQGFALVGLVLGLWVLSDLKAIKRGEPSRLIEAIPSSPETGESGGRTRKKRGTEGPREFVSTWSRKAPDMALVLFTVVEGFSVATFLVQIPLTYALRRLQYEQRWYIVTDRSLRLRTGIWKVQEVTMSFANLQQITVTQGPLQRLLGLADVRVKSAGGGAGVTPGHGKPDDSAHAGYFRAVDNAEEIRDLITERLRRFRESGLGDPEETRRAAAPEPSDQVSADSLAAARELLLEARALREAAAKLR